MKKSIAVFGCGKMGAALVRGVVKSGTVEAESIICFDVHRPSAETLAAEFGLRVAATAKEAADGAEVALVCVKPPDVASLLREIADGAGRLVVSIAAGVKIAALEKASATRVVRVMPNTPAMIGKGYSAYAVSTAATPEDEAFVERVFGSVGLVSKVPESMMDAVTGLSGSGPAFAYTVIEALAEGACLCGIPKDRALQMAAQTVAGAAELVLATGTHPAVLRDQVTSPGGTTMAGLAAMERAGVRAGLIDAVQAAATRSAELGRL